MSFKKLRLFAAGLAVLISTAAVATDAPKDAAPTKQQFCTDLYARLQASRHPSSVDVSPAGVEARQAKLKEDEDRYFNMCIKVPDVKK